MRQAQQRRPTPSLVLAPLATRSHLLQLFVRHRRRRRRHSAATRHGRASRRTRRRKPPRGRRGRHGGGGRGEGAHVARGGLRGERRAARQQGGESFLGVFRETQSTSVFFPAARPPVFSASCCRSAEQTAREPTLTLAGRVAPQRTLFLAPINRRAHSKSDAPHHAHLHPARRGGRLSVRGV